ncbi:hypothetical protein Vadar_026811 [Vaccinium darrowii]|uniref:Uncharacterized protein n=1 Tax=Vaccinium darrowii TaxID=229202 RepID=A0ACB7X4R1_9ERIC|nr:hypothetical protein Vadar_026811 [Vaccinium darrowii]
MKKWCVGIVGASLFMLLFLLRYGVTKYPISETYVASSTSNTNNHLELINYRVPPVVWNPENGSRVVSANTTISTPFAQTNLSSEEKQTLQTNETNPLEWINSGAPRAVQNPENGSQVVSANTIISTPIAQRNLSNEEKQTLQNNATNLLEWINSGASRAVQNPENGSQVVSANTIISTPIAQRNLSNEEKQTLQNNATNLLEGINSGAPLAVRSPENGSQVVSANTIISTPVAQRNISNEEKKTLQTNATNPLDWINSGAPPEVQNPQNGSQVVSDNTIFPALFAKRNHSNEEKKTLQTNATNATNPLEWINFGAPPAVHNPKNGSQVVSAHIINSTLFAQRNLSNEEKQTLQTWNRLKHFIENAHVLPNAIEAIEDAGLAWNELMTSVEEERLAYGNESSRSKGKQKLCPPFLSKMNVTGPDNSGFELQVPCGLTQGSSITVIGIPSAPLGNFQIDLTEEQLPGGPDPPIILHYNVRLHGDMITEGPVIVQNTWTGAHDWGEEERCPSPDPPEEIKQVYGLEQCNNMVGKHFNGSRKFVSNGSKTRTYFPFKQGYLFVATLRVGTEGIQMTVDGNQITSFAFRESLEPWLVSDVRISGDIKLVSVVASGLPTSEDMDQIIDSKALMQPPLRSRKPLDLFVGVFSTANNFKKRMAVRRTWMQYAAVRSGAVAVRFFVGLHKNRMVNDELWNEAQTYRDIQMMPFVDYYSLITWKTLAICIFGTEVVSAKYVMKTDDDSFVRVDEVLASLKMVNVTRGLLYGLINSETQPHRNPYSKWYISEEEWPDDEYPTWANGPGYVVSHDIAKAVCRSHRKGRLKMFKLEDVAMGIWIADIQKRGLEVRYVMEERIVTEGCSDGYVIAHYQGPGEMLCLWQKLQELKHPICCHTE